MLQSEERAKKSLAAKRGNQRRSAGGLIKTAPWKCDVDGYLKRAEEKVFFFQE